FWKGDDVAKGCGENPQGGRPCSPPRGALGMVTMGGALVPCPLVPGPFPRLGGSPLVPWPWRCSLGSPSGAFGGVLGMVIIGPVPWPWSLVAPRGALGPVPLAAPLGALGGPLAAVHWGYAHAAPHWWRTCAHRKHRAKASKALIVKGFRGA